MPKKKTYDQKHLSINQRILIEEGLNDGLSFAAIARKLNKHPSTVAKEVKKHRTFQSHEKHTPDPLQCDFVRKAPYVCNHCSCQQTCPKSKIYYIASDADKSYQNLLVSCRQGINQSPTDIALLDDLISPLLAQGQSLAHIYAFHKHEITCSRKTLYNYINQGIFAAKNINLQHKSPLQMQTKKN